MSLKAERQPEIVFTETIRKNRLKEIYRPVGNELPLVEELIGRACSSMDLICSDTHLLHAGGKRIRPALVLLSSLYGKGPVSEVIRLAAAVEILHLATLVHDDLIDCSDSRRGKPSVNRLWGSNAALLAGDYLYALFLEHTAGFDKHIIASLAGCLRNMVKAEMMQQQLLYECNICEKDYVKRTHFKSGSFLSCCCRLGTYLAGATPKAQLALEQYGWFMGIAFQIKDDILDFQGDETNLGKPVAQDLKQGVLTLPVIYTLKNSPAGDELRRIIENKEFNEANIQYIIRELEDCGALSYTAKMAERYSHLAGHALSELPDNIARESFEALLTFVITREL